MRALPGSATGGKTLLCLACESSQMHCATSRAKSLMLNVLRSQLGGLQGVHGRAPHREALAVYLTLRLFYKLCQIGVVQNHKETTVACA